MEYNSMEYNDIELSVMMSENPSRYDMETGEYVVQFEDESLMVYSVGEIYTRVRDGYTITEWHSLPGPSHTDYPGCKGIKDYLDDSYVITLLKDSNNAVKYICPCCQEDVHLYVEARKKDSAVPSKNCTYRLPNPWRAKHADHLGGALLIGMKNPGHDLDIIDYMVRGRSYSTQDLERLTGLSKKTVQKKIRAAREEGKLSSGSVAHTVQIGLSWIPNKERLDTLKAIIMLMILRNIQEYGGYTCEGVLNELSKMDGGREVGEEIIAYIDQHQDEIISSNAKALWYSEL